LTRNHPFFLQHPAEIAVGNDPEQAARFIHRTVSPTPQYPWPKLRARAGCTVWVKHENHTPTGAFKVRGGLLYLERLLRALPESYASEAEKKTAETGRPKTVARRSCDL